MIYRIYFLEHGLEKPYDQTSALFKERFYLKADLSSLEKIDRIPEATRLKMYEFKGAIDESKYQNGYNPLDNIFFIMQNDFKPQELHEQCGRIRSMSVGDVVVDQRGNAFFCSGVGWKKIENRGQF